VLSELKSGVPDRNPLNAQKVVPEATSPDKIISAFLTPILSIKKPPIRGRTKFGKAYTEYRD